MKNVLYPTEARLPLRGGPSLLFGLFSLLIAGVLFGPSRTLSASDPCSPDRQPPRITFCPPDILVECSTLLTPPNTGGSAVAVDLCDPSPLVTYADGVALAVTPTDLDGWGFAVQGFPVTALAEMIAGPGNPPLGSGSFHASIGANGENLAEIRNFSFDHVPLAGLTELSYGTYRTMDGAGLNRNIYLMLNVDTDGDGFEDDVIYFEPRFQHGSNPGLPDQGAMVTGTWQKWNAYLGGWWSLNHPEVMAPGANVQSLATFLATFPGARIVNGLSGGGVRLTAGGGADVWNNFDGHADYFVLGTNGVSRAYDFDLSAVNVCPTVTIRTWTATDASGNKASCHQTITVADRQPPVVTCAASKTVECGTPWIFDVPTYSDECVFEALVFDNSLNDTNYRFSSGTTEVGDEIILEGTARQITRFAFEYFGVNKNTQAAEFEGAVTARVRFYANDATGFYRAPQTVLYDSGDFTVPATTRSVVTIEDFQLDAALPLVGNVPDSFTWTVQFSGLGENDAAGLDIYTPIVVGFSYRDYWERTPLGWQIKTNAHVKVDFAARIDAARESVRARVINTETNTTGACGQAFVATRTWEAVDPCGNVAQCSQVVTLADRTKPVVVCPPNVTVECGQATDPSATGTASATDACASSVPVTFSDVAIPGACPQARVIARTWTASDPCGNEGRCVQSIAIRDSSPPLIVCPGTITTSIGTGLCEKVVEFTATATDACSGVAVECIPPSGHPFPKGTTTVTCTATDTCGNQNSCSFSVVVASLTFSQTVNRAIPDNSPGGLTNTLTVTTEVTSITDLDVTLSLNHTWNGDLHAYLVHDTGRAVLLNRVGRRLTVPADLLGHGDDGFDVTLDDEAANGDVHVYRMKLFGNHNTPVVGPLTGNWAPDGRATPPSQATESDPRTALLSAFRGMNPNGQWTLVVADVQAGDAGALQSWSLRLCGNVGVAPTITAPPVSVTVECTTHATFSVTAIGSPPLSYQWHFGPNPINGATETTLTVPDVQSADLGDYSVVVMNGFGQVSSGVATLSLADTRPPQIACPPAIVVPTAPGQCTAVVASYGVSASDTCGSVTIVCAPPEGHRFDKGPTPVHCTATDAANNAAECSFTVTVEDRELPTLACPANIAVGTLAGQCSAVVTYATLSAADNCTDVTVSCVPRSGESFRGGSTPVVCTATDAAGNRSECTFTVTVRDRERPEVCMDPPMTFSAGGMDNFVGPQPTSPSTTLQAYTVTHALALQDFDAPVADQWLAHSFGGFPASISSARLLIRARALSTASLDDSLQLVFSQAGGLLRSEQWTRRFGLHEAVPGLLPVAWSAGTESEFELDLARLPNADGTHANLLPVLRQVGALDLLVQNDSEVDYVTLEIETCQCSTRIVVDSDPGQCSSRVMFPLPAFFDNCDLNPTVVCRPPPGATFALGVTRVDCSATDVGGNVGHCSFEVTVNAAGLELSYARAGANLVLSWPVGCGNCELVESSSLDSPIVWTPSPVSVNTVGSLKTATVPISGPQNFFCLRKTLP